MSENLSESLINNEETSGSKHNSESHIYSQIRTTETDLQIAANF